MNFTLHEDPVWEGFVIHQLSLPLSALQSSQAPACSRTHDISQIHIQLDNVV